MKEKKTAKLKIEFKKWKEKPWEKVEEWGSDWSGPTGLPGFGGCCE